MTTPEVKPAVRAFDALLPNQPRVMDHFRGTGEQYVADLFGAICQASGIGDPRRDYDLVQSDMFTIEEMASNPVLLRFMEVLVKLVRAKRALEIGTFVGLSTMNIARAMGPDGKVITVEKFDKFAQLARENFRRNGFGDRIQLKLGDAHEIIPTLRRDELFDLAFIDGDKGRYLDYFRMVEPLMAPKGLIVVDDVFFHGDAINPQPTTEKGRGVKQFLDAMASLTSYTRVGLPMGNGVMLIFKD